MDFNNEDNINHIIQTINNEDIESKDYDSLIITLKILILRLIINFLILV